MEAINKIYHKAEQLRRKTLSWVALHFMRPPKILSLDETLDLIINEHYSVSRNGDGELNLMLGERIDFQHADSRMRNLLKEALNARLDKYISCLPNIFVDYSRFHEKAQGYFGRYLQTKRYFYYTYAKAPEYGDAFISRFYIDLKDKSHSASQVAKLKKIWEKQDVVLVEGKDSRLGVNNDLFSGTNSLKRILGPAINAFDRYDELISTISEVANNDTLILLALGPTATVMAYELAKAGYWAVDIGHIDIEYEWFRMGATSKVVVPGKYTNECDDCKLSGDLPEESILKYNSEIIATIK